VSGPGIAESVKKSGVADQGENSSMHVSGDGTCIVSGSDDKTLRLWQIESGEVLSLLELDTFRLLPGMVTVWLETIKGRCRCSA
jgi:WD40 repeat protein